MPIYAYRCGSCGHAKDVLQNLSAQPLTRCPACGAEAFAKQLTAAGFQLKGSGWYVTDFRGGSSAPAQTDDAKAEAKTGAKAGTGRGRRHRRCCGKSSAERKHLQRQQQFFFCPVELSSGMAALRKW